MKWFEQVVLQVESYSMNVILWIFKRSIYSGTLFFKYLTKKLPEMMDDLFRWANKYSMLEDNVWAATQQVRVTNRPTRHDHAGNSKPSTQSRQNNKGRDG